MHRLARRFEDRIDHPPCPLHLVEADEIRRISADDIGQQRLVRVPLGFVILAVAGVHPDHPGLHSQPRLLGVNLQMHALAGLDAEQHPVRCHVLHRSLAEQLLRRVPKAQRNQRGLLRQAFSGAHIERHAPPAPVVDVKAGGNVGFGERVGADAGLPAIRGCRFAFHVSPVILPSQDVF